MLALLWYVTGFIFFLFEIRIHNISVSVFNNITIIALIFFIYNDIYRKTPEFSEK